MSKPASRPASKDVKQKSKIQIKKREDVQRRSDEVEMAIPHRANPYPLEPTFLMALRGDWSTGGVLEFFLGERRLGCIKLARAPWAVLASLFLAAIHPRSTHWLDAFVMTESLIQQLTKHDLASFPTEQTVYRHVNTIRTKLAATFVHKFTGSAHLSGKQWAERVLENNVRIGYRMGLPPSQLRLFLGNIEHAPTTAEGGTMEGEEKEKTSSIEFSNDKPTR